MENLMTVVDRLDELQASSGSRSECSSMDVHRHMQSALPTGDGLWWPLTMHMWWWFRNVCAALCIRRTLCRYLTIGAPMVIFAVLTVFWLFLTNGTLYQSSKTLKTIGVTIVTGLPGLYQQCTNRQKQTKTVKRQSKQQKWPSVYQSSHVYQDCTNSVPTMYKSSKTVKRQWNQQKMTTGVPIITGLPRLCQQCTNRQKQ